MCDSLQSYYVGRIDTINLREDRPDGENSHNNVFLEIFFIRYTNEGLMVLFLK